MNQTNYYPELHKQETDAELIELLTNNLVSVDDGGFELMMGVRLIPEMAAMISTAYVNTLHCREYIAIQPLYSNPGIIDRLFMDTHLMTLNAETKRVMPFSGTPVSGGEHLGSGTNDQLCRLIGFDLAVSDQRRIIHDLVEYSTPSLAYLSRTATIDEAVNMFNDEANKITRRIHRGNTMALVLNTNAFHQSLPDITKHATFVKRESNNPQYIGTILHKIDIFMEMHLPINTMIMGYMNKNNKCDADYIFCPFSPLLSDNTMYSLRHIEKVLLEGKLQYYSNIVTSIHG